MRLTVYSHFYKRKYVVRYEYIGTDLNIDIVEVFELLTFDKGIVSMSLYIEPHKWKNIALLSITESNKQTLLNHGVEILESKFLYDDEIDALIQLAFICSKYMVAPSKIFDCSNGRLTTIAYKKLVNTFYDDFPEKYI
jgi:hypothetical protein